MLYIQLNYPNMHTFYMVISPQFTCKKQNTLQCQFERSKKYKSTHYLKIKLLSPPPKNSNYKTYLNFCSNKIKPAKTLRKFMEAAEHNLHLATWLVRHYTLMTGKNWTTYIRTSRSSNRLCRKSKIKTRSHYALSFPPSKYTFMRIIFYTFLYFFRQTQ